jgi:hypothetical protein
MRQYERVSNAPRRRSKPAFQQGHPWHPGNPENRERTRQLQRELRGRLLAWDPIGVGGVPEAQDEYDCLISPLMHRLHQGVPAREIATWLTAETKNHFGLTTQPASDRRLAGELVRWWHNTTLPA